ncbi:unnamed protein product [Bemisia tabaci]|uniref:Uncharacterized protein n=1 Tax=Bemisia tabaci TaxID=7038 RepID=A0A9P0ACU7_BEMTA|nr:unnamed protein product [Bemisia tabaci]
MSRRRVQAARRSHTPIVEGVLASLSVLRKPCVESTGAPNLSEIRPTKYLVTTLSFVQRFFVTFLLSSKPVSSDYGYKGSKCTWKERTVGQPPPKNPGNFRQLMTVHSAFVVYAADRVSGPFLEDEPKKPSGASSKRRNTALQIGQKGPLAPSPPRPAGADETSAVHALSKRGWFGRSRSKGVPPPPPAYGHPYRPMPPPPPARRRGGFGKAAGMLLPVAAGAAAGYLTTSLVLNQMKKENPCALHGAGFTADGQMDSRIAANQRSVNSVRPHFGGCQSMLQKYSSWFNSPNAGGNTNSQQGGGTMNPQQNMGSNAVNPQQNGMMSPNGMSPNG